MDDQRLGLHHCPPEVVGRFVIKEMPIGGDVRSVKASDGRSMPPREMQRRCIAESHQGFGITPASIKVEAGGNAVRAFASSGCEHSAHTRIAERVVQIRKPVFIASGKEMTVLVEGVLAEFDIQPPTVEDLRRLLHTSTIWRTRRGHEANAVAGA